MFLTFILLLIAYCWLLLLSRIKSTDLLRFAPLKSHETTQAFPVTTEVTVPHVVVAVLHQVFDGRLAAAATARRRRINENAPS